MAILGKENLEAEVAKRAKFRLNHVGTKLNQAELRAFEALVEKRQQTQGEFIRELIAGEVRRDQEGERPSPEMVEIVAVRLLLMNLFKSQLVTGELLPVEKWDWYLTEVSKRKRAFAADMLASYRKDDGPKPKPTTWIGVLCNIASSQ
jgi:hypothetical protein